MRSITNRMLCATTLQGSLNYRPWTSPSHISVHAGTNLDHALILFCVPLNANRDRFLRQLGTQTKDCFYFAFRSIQIGIDFSRQFNAERVNSRMQAFLFCHYYTDLCRLNTRRAFNVFVRWTEFWKSSHCFNDRQSMCERGLALFLSLKEYLNWTDRFLSACSVAVEAGPPKKGEKRFSETRRSIQRKGWQPEIKGDIWEKMNEVVFGLDSASPVQSLSLLKWLALSSTEIVTFCVY